MVPMEEHRLAHRQRVLKRACIIKVAGQNEISCTIRNQHEGGAELRVGVDDLVPASFLLYIQADGLAYRAEIRWRKGERIGVSFIGKEPRPKQHYD